MIDYLNKNPGIVPVICALITFLGAILSAILGAVIGRRAGKKAAQKEVGELRVHLEQRITQLNAEQITNVEKLRVHLEKMEIKLNKVRIFAQNQKKQTGSFGDNGTQQQADVINN
jgi:hypothetical protein